MTAVPLAEGWDGVTRSHWGRLRSNIRLGRAVWNRRRERDVKSCLPFHALLNFFTVKNKRQVLLNIKTYSESRSQSLDFFQRHVYGHHSQDQLVLDLQ